MKIERLEVKNFRSMYDPSVEFGRITVLIGRNSSGKTSILNAIRVIFENLDTISTEKNLDVNTITEQGLRDQIRGLWFYTHQNKPIKLAVSLNFDKEEGDILRDICGLESGVEKAYIEVSIEKNDNRITWKLQNIVVYGHVTETVKIAKEALEGMKEIHSKVTKRNVDLKAERFNPLTQCVIVENGSVKNEEVFKSFLDIIKDKVYYMDTFSGTSKMADIPIKGLFTQSITPLELMNSIRNVIRTFALRKMLYDYLRQIRGNIYEYEQPDRAETLTKSYEGTSLSYELFGSGDQITEGILASIISKGKHHVFLVEEPEVHLHPAYVRSLAKVLEILANSLDVQLIIVTHSPDFIAGLKDKRFVVGVRKELIETELEGYSTTLPATIVFYPFRGGRLSESLARELGVMPGYFLFLDTVILVEGNSDRILLQRYIDILIEKQLLENLPKLSYTMVPFGQRNLKELIKVLRDDYGLRVFVIADNDQQGRKAVNDAKEMRLRENYEAFTTNRKDILCYIKSEDFVKALDESLRENLEDNYDVVMQNKEIRSIIDEMKLYGACKNGEDLLHRLSGILFNVLKGVDENILDTLEWHKGSLIERDLKQKIAEKIAPKLTEVPDDIMRVILSIDREVGVAYGGRVI